MDRRLLAIAEEVGLSHRVLDVGTDHGYLAVYLVEQGLAERAIVSDISSNSLQKAINLIARKRLSLKIDSRLGSGLDILRAEDEVDKIVIAGMGGNLISDIVLQRKDFLTDRNILLILQPMQNSEVVRKKLLENHIGIVGERLVKEAGKIYQIIIASLSEKPTNYDRWELEFGKKENYSTPEQQELFRELLENKISEMKEICDKISQAGASDGEGLIQKYLGEIKQISRMKS